MAKRRRKDDEEDEEFKLPEFKEEEFLRKEILSAKVMMVTVLLAIAGAVVSYLLTLGGVVVVAFFAGLSLLFLLRYIVKFFGIDSSKFERKDWLGHWMTYFFAWLAIWILLLNVPFSDVTQPSLTVIVNGGEVKDPSIPIFVNGSAEISVRAIDNSGIKGVWITIAGSENPMNRQGDSNTWLYNLSISASTMITITAEDVSGNPPVSITFVVY